MNPHQEVQKLIEGNEELAGLYARFGYSAYANRRSEEITDELRSLVRVSIPDFAAFQRAMAEVQDEVERHKRGEVPHDPLLMSSTDLYEAVKSAASNYERVLELLNAQPVSGSLPNHVEWTAVRRLPKDSVRFAKLLDELEEGVRNIWTLPPEEVREEVLYDIRSVREFLKGARSVAVALQGLPYNIERAYRFLDWNSEGDEKKSQLDEFLLKLLSARHTYGPEYPAFAEVAREQAYRYLHTTWMHTRWLTSYLLTALLDAHLAPLTADDAQASLSPLVSALASTREEVVSGHYDPQEIERRLRHLEDKGLHIHSLTYPLLRLASSSARPDN